MTRLLMRLLGRMPIGWLQLVANKIRFSSAVAGVTFACILVFVQLGMMGAFREATRVSYRALNADIMISSSDANSLTEGSNVARRRMFQALAVPGVLEAQPLFIGRVTWLQEDGSKIEFTTIGIDPARPSFIGPAIGDINTLKLANNVLLDSRARGMKPDILSEASREFPLWIEAHGQQIAIVGTVSLGGGFSGDGYMVVSDQTFMRLFPSRISGAPNHILLKVVPGEDPREVADRIRKELASSSLKVRSFSDAIDEDIKYQTTRRPTGLIFGFGVAIGTIVGFVIVYQILSTDVADHLREYATFKAMGYNQRFFRSIIMKQAVILAVTGFFPALLATLGIYHVMANATGLPIEMGPARAIMVLVGTMGSCVLSGISAMRKLATADPADLF